MTSPHLSLAVRGWLAEQLDTLPTRLAIETLPGATSSSLYRVQSPRRTAVLRLLDNAAWLAEESDLAAHEAAALEEAARGGLPAPRLIAWDDRRVAEWPLLLMTLVPGEIVLRPPDRAAWRRALAESLAAIHRHPATGLAWHYRSWVNAATVAVPSWSARPELWARAIERWRQGPPPSTPCFIHRDYHPTNVLWQGGAISGVVDWINGCRGPAGVDVAHCRTDLALLAGAEEAAAFLAAYRAAQPGYRHDPYWDIDSLLDAGDERATFYPPWAEFGLPLIPQRLLWQRLDDHLAYLLAD